MRFLALLALVAAPLLAVPAAALAQDGQAWATTWAASVQGPYPVGNPSAQPEQRFAFPSAQTGAHDQTLRLVVRPSLWGRQARFRFSNAFGTKPLSLDGAFVGLHLGGAAVVTGTNRPVRFGGRDGVTIRPGEWAWSDPVDLPFAADPDSPLLAGRKLAVSVHVAGESGPMTWHAKALQTSYATAPDRDVLSLSGVSTVVWLEGTNDFSRNGNASAEAVQAGMREAVGRMRARLPGVRVVGATVVSALNSTSPAHGFAEQDEKRKALNAFVRSSGLFDAVVDFDAATLDPVTGGLRPEMVPDSTTGGPGDRLHPNRAGYLAMGASVDLGAVTPPALAKPR